MSFNRKKHYLFLMGFALVAFSAFVLYNIKDIKPESTTSHIIQANIGTKVFQLEVADTDRLRQLGLGDRDSLSTDHGMLFLLIIRTSMGFG